MLIAQFLVVGALAADVIVTDATELRAAVDNASPGDVILLQAGAYPITSTLNCDTSGTVADPIVVRAETLGDATITADTVIAFKVSAPYWTFENLDIQGICTDHSSCEHAFQIVGAADHTTIRGSRLHDWNAQIKANGEDPGGGRVWPDDVLIEHSELYSSTGRQTANPVTPIDVVGGQRWIVRGNFIHDFHKDGGNTISYAAFLKGHGADGLFERNLVACEYLHTGGVRLGLSLGGGGSSPDYICEQGDCSIEHLRGILRNNVIARCPTDVCMYLNEAVDTKVYNNTMYDCTGVDARFGVTTADVRNNVLSGSIRERDGASVTQSSNLTGMSASDWTDWFTDPANLDFTLVDGYAVVDAGENLADVTDDFCENARDDGFNDIGAVEYDGDVACITTEPWCPDETTTTTTTTTTATATDTDTDTDTTDTDTTPTDTPTTTPTGATDTDAATEADDKGGCACANAGGPSGYAGLILLLGLLRRRSSG